MSWTVRTADPDAARELGRASGVGPTLGQVLLHRGFGDAEGARAFLEPKLASLSAPDAMRDRAPAAERLGRAVRAKERIVVFGDYDVDGTTSAAILSDILAALGADVVALVARRFEGGYGFSREALARARDAGAELIVTCDCGSSDHERIADAMAAGIDVIVIDHHLVPAEPLPAFAFLNPHRPDCGFPYKGLASAGLALSVGAAVRKEIGANLDVRAWLDLVAIGTVADVAPLDGDNRALVRAGLERLSEGATRPGISALREAAQMKPGFVGAVDIAFRLAPRLNAAGRIGDPQVTLDLLRATSPEQARTHAAEIERLNLERRMLERRITAEAEATALAQYGDAAPEAVVVGSEGWHRGVVGITAARLVDRFHAPALVVAFDGDEGHGSGRAPEGFPLYDVLKRASEPLSAFGGHHAATGFSLKRSKFGEFREAFEAAAKSTAFVPVAPTPEADVRVDGATFPLPTARELRLLEPVGECNREPLFEVADAEVARASGVGEGGAHLKLDLRVGGARLSGFGYELGARKPELGSTVDVHGSLRPDTWRGGDAIELRIGGIL
ncbi:MAG: single-stranded-DNA-specific exonuclease RecJ [Myxococcales bacterium]|nr:single-stranded-DNA-specific exonuclease RecJ [Myxococcales bacterium]